MPAKDYDAVVVGSGPNGLAAAITLQQAGLSVLIMEGKDSIGGGLRTASLTLPGFSHDVCSAVHPLAADSPFFKTLPLADHGLKYIYPDIAAAHPLDDGNAALLLRSVEETAERLGQDRHTYVDLIKPLEASWPKIAKDILGPLHYPRHPMLMAKFGLNALTAATHLARQFKTESAKALWGGMAAHGLQPLTNLSTSAIALVLITCGHIRGWPIPEGGSKSIANALASYFLSLGGEIQTNAMVRSLGELPTADAVLLDVTPRQLLSIGGRAITGLYKRQLERFRYGMGVFKIDWALNAPIPFKATDCRRAGTIHIGGSFEEVAASEKMIAAGKHPEKPFVLLAQQSVFDATRAPENKHTGWAYCHTPNGSRQDMTAAIEQQVERFAPGFRDTIIERHVMNTAAMEAYNPNYIGGDINGGVSDISQLFTRPVLKFSPYKTSAKGVYICSSSTPPGGGVHGMCGYHAARSALKHTFKIRPLPL
jgi:phytoene dehydrogenase-like protein